MVLQLGAIFQPFDFLFSIHYTKKSSGGKQYIKYISYQLFQLYCDVKLLCAAAALRPYIVIIVCWGGCSEDWVAPLYKGTQPLLHPPDLWENLHKLCWTRVTVDKQNTGYWEAHNKKKTIENQTWQPGSKMNNIIKVKILLFESAIF